MPQSQTITLGLLAVGCLGLLAGAVYAVAMEASPFATQSLGERATVRAMSSDLLHPGLSIQSQIDFLYHCRSAMTSIAGRAQPSNVRAEILSTCGTASKEIAASSPGFSAAFYTSALVASFTQDDATLNEGLEHSYETAPYEQWVAELRTDLVEDNFSRIEPRLLKRHQADLLLQLSNDRGRRFLAPRYLTFEGLRSRLDRLLTQDGAEGSKRFLNIVERLRVERSRTNGR